MRAASVISSVTTGALEKRFTAGRRLVTWGCSASNCGPAGPRRKRCWGAPLSRTNRSISRRRSLNASGWRQTFRGAGKWLYWRRRGETGTDRGLRHRSADLRSGASSTAPRNGRVGDRRSTPRHPADGGVKMRRLRNPSPASRRRPSLTMLAWTIYISFLGVVISMLLPRDNARSARIVALLTALGGLAIALAGALNGEAAMSTLCDVDWVPSLGIHYHLAADGISLTLVVLTGVAAVAGILFSWNIEHRAKEFFAFYLALIGGVYGVFLSFDLFLLFVFYEIAIIPKYFIIAIWGSTRREYGAMKLALYSFVGSAMVLVGLIAAYVVSGAKTTSLFELAKFPFPEPFQYWAFPLVFVGFAILAGLWPFHTWAPPGHVAAPTAASM